MIKCHREYNDELRAIRVKDSDVPILMLVDRLDKLIEILEKEKNEPNITAIRYYGGD